MRKILFISALLLASCGASNPATETGGAVEGTVSIAYLKTLWKGAPVKITGELRISGNVVSSDAAGNFYKTLVVDDGTGGIEVKLDLEDIFKHFRLHTAVDIRCNGLWLGSYGGTLQLGAEPWEDWQTQYIPESEIPLHCQSAGVPAEEVVALRLDFRSIAPQHISSFAGFEGVQFIDGEVGLNWTETDTEETGGATDRHLVDSRGDTLTVRTNSHALFAGKTLPSGSGYIEGVLNYFNGAYQLILCDDQKAIMESPRFRPVEE